MAAVTSAWLGCNGNHSGGFGQVRGICGTTALGPAAVTAIISSTEITMAAAEIQPRNPARVPGGAGLAGEPTLGVAGGPAVVVTPPCPCPSPTVLRIRLETEDSVC